MQLQLHPSTPLRAHASLVSSLPPAIIKPRNTKRLGSDVARVQLTWQQLKNQPSEIRGYQMT